MIASKGRSFGSPDSVLVLCFNDTTAPPAAKQTYRADFYDLCKRMFILFVLSTGQKWYKVANRLAFKDSIAQFI